jgi:hypothetical protein
MGELGKEVDRNIL